MKNKLPLILLLVLSISAFAQRKSDLIAEIDNLKVQISEVEQELAKAKREISSANAKSETLASENASLRDANATLLGNLSNFSELSKQNSENVNRAMAALALKEKQLSGISDMISANDSIAIVSLTRIKQTLGENANVSVGEGAIVISSSLNNLFGSDSSTELTEEGKAWLVNVAKVIKNNPSFKTQVEGLNITGEFGPSYDKAAAVTKELVTTLKVSSTQLAIVVRDGNFQEGVNIKLLPDYKAFYAKAKESAKVAK
jgi:outer membrane protein OmpA-like peptidoglycan-associated protein